ncbi:hypothetical protein N0V93_009169 [Gnomoniopsis smithogilvyi]|uniref:Uncharacterized protein n=1 Tax=Gnomoniopsis smithogilvyi TaxID=1191159 RepID=A0A9W9CSK5_9PEZI|nr:hypothetical protein N0V93_009169 [Gnomoniopsis smithogilvyi]
MTRSNTSHGQDGGYSDCEAHGQRRWDKLRSQQLGDTTSAMKKEQNEKSQRVNQEKTETLNGYSDRMGHTLGGCSYGSGLDIQGVAAVRKGLRLPERLPSNPPNPQAFGTASQSSAGASGSVPGSINNRFSGSVSGLFSMLQTEMRHGGAPMHSSSTGNVYDMNSASNAAQTSSRLSATGAAQRDGNGDDTEIDMDDYFMMPFSSP